MVDPTGLALADAIIGNAMADPIQFSAFNVGVDQLVAEHRCARSPTESRLSPDLRKTRLTVRGETPTSAAIPPCRLDPADVGLDRITCGRRSSS
jgi:hypothetical protein